ncbi:hypothetical protein C8R44DRAFT_749824 [Mycena epipterygia]|nr:hypothetical protein C8R44DRAFT_749824 [Mycena epipterygia]
MVPKDVRVKCFEGSAGSVAGRICWWAIKVAETIILQDALQLPPQELHNRAVQNLRYLKDLKTKQTRVPLRKPVKDTHVNKRQEEYKYARGFRIACRTGPVTECSLRTGKGLSSDIQSFWYCDPLFPLGSLWKRSQRVAKGASPSTWLNNASLRLIKSSIAITIPEFQQPQRPVLNLKPTRRFAIYVGQAPLNKSANGTYSNKRQEKCNMLGVSESPARQDQWPSAVCIAEEQYIGKKNSQ